METAVASTSASKTHADIERWLVRYIAELRGIREERIASTATFDTFGLDSASAATLSGDLMEWLECDLDPSVIYEFPTIAKLASYLSAELQSERGGK